MAVILAAEDDEEVRQAIAIGLAEFGHKVVGVGEGEIVEKARDVHPDLILLDFERRGGNGWDLLKSLRDPAHSFSARVVLMTDRAHETDFVSGLRMGADGHLTKPFDLDELVLIVHETLMMSADQLTERRKRELERADLLQRVETFFGE